jgi:hypothetical protein
MMISALIGFAVSFAPKLLDLFRDERDKGHELKMLRFQLEREEKIQAGKIKEARIEGATARDVAAIEAERELEVERERTFQVAQREGGRRALAHRSGIGWVDAALGLVDVLNGSVRPVLTYSLNGAFLWLVITGEITVDAAGLAVASGGILIATLIELTLAVDGYWFGYRLQKRWGK